MGPYEPNQQFNNTSLNYLQEQFQVLRSMLSYALNIDPDEIKISFPALQNFYVVNGVCKSSWAIYVYKDHFPKLLYTGNFLIQGGKKHSKRSSKSVFGAEALSSLTSVANTFSLRASLFKQNWTTDLSLYEKDNDKLMFSVREYQEFLKLLNSLRVRWLLHLSEEGNYDYVISEISEPTDSLFFMDLENFDSTAAKIKTYFKPISQKALTLFQKLALGTEFEGRFTNLQPGTWIKDDVLIELEKLYSDRFFGKDKVDMTKSMFSEEDESEYEFNNPFKVHALKPSI